MIVLRAVRGHDHHDLDRNTLRGEPDRFSDDQSLAQGQGGSPRHTARAPVKMRRFMRTAVAGVSLEGLFCFNNRFRFNRNITPGPGELLPNFFLSVARAMWPADQDLEVLFATTFAAVQVPAPWDHRGKTTKQRAKVLRCAAARKVLASVAQGISHSVRRLACNISQA
jgi:hypothetical protein